jgi:tetratricopeptide (TPR) repeat protein
MDSTTPLPRLNQVSNVTKPQSFNTTVPITHASAGIETFLQSYADEGSEVAKRMIQTRKIWEQGEEYLFGGDFNNALSCFVTSIRTSARDSDSFLGRFSSETLSEMKRLLNVMKSQSHIDSVKADLYLLDTALLVFEGNVQEAIEQVKEGIKLNPNDAEGLLYSAVTLHGCLGQWEIAETFIELCLNLQPEEAIFYYWKGIAVKMIKCSSPVALKNLSWVDDCVAYFRRYIDGAYEEGRKYAQAHYEIAFLNALRYFKDAKSHAKLIPLIEKAKDSEKVLLPVFPSLQCDAKTHVLKMLPLLSKAKETMQNLTRDEATTNQVAIVENLRLQANTKLLLSTRRVCASIQTI